MTRRNFNYRITFASQVKMAENKKSGFYDTVISSDTRIYRAKEGWCSIRILPPTWKDAEHYGFKVFVHTNVGGDNKMFLCLEENADSPSKVCPICEERRQLSNQASDEERAALRCYERYIINLIDRDDEAKGIQTWMISGNLNAEISASCIDIRRGTVIDIVDPYDGYDLRFYRQGSQINTKYNGWQASREKSPLSDNEKKMDEWLNLIEKRPIPSLLQFKSAEVISDIFYGKRGKDERRNDRSDRNDFEETAATRSRDSGQETSLKDYLDDEIPPFDVDGKTASEEVNQERIARMRNRIRTLRDEDEVSE